jgi:hypothetical protein
MRTGTNRKHQFALLAIAALVLVAAGTAEGRTTGPSPLQKSLSQLAAAGAPGAILFARDGNHAVRFTSGLADISRKSPDARRRPFSDCKPDQGRRCNRRSSARR